MDAKIGETALPSLDARFPIELDPDVASTGSNQDSAFHACVLDGRAPGRPLVTVVIPSLNQGRFLDEALSSVFTQEVAVEVFVIDGGSVDSSIGVIKKWEHRLSGWRSHPDGGQATAINEGVALGTAPYVCWLNSDDWLLPGGLNRLLADLAQHTAAPAAYARTWTVKHPSGKRSSTWVQPFNEQSLATRCIVSQPATLIRRSAWQAVGGLDTSLHMAMDYDLWWRLFKLSGPLSFSNEFVAVARDHRNAKTRSFRRDHYREAIQVVRRHHRLVPIKWWIAQPYSVWLKGLSSFIGLD